MELIRLTEHAYQLRGGSNAGLIVQGERGLLIDTGLDRDTAKKILRHLEGLRVRLEAVLITHAHADHFGGAALIKSRLGVPVFAPALEAAIVANPILEPLYLFSGAWPAAELRHKFTLAEACEVDGLLELGDRQFGDIRVTLMAAPGHAPNQVIVAGGDVCYIADALFAPDVLHKHGIPFYVDIDRTLATLAALQELDGRFAAFVPGHGPAPREIGPWVEENREHILRIRQAVGDALGQATEPAHLIRSVANALALSITNPVIYWLTQTTVLACLASLQAAGRASVAVVDNQILWRPAA